MLIANAMIGIPLKGIVEPGFENGWIFRKYNDGTFDAWYYQHPNGTKTSADDGNGIYGANGVIEVPSFVKSIEYMNVQCTFTTLYSWSSCWGSKTNGQVNYRIFCDRVHTGEIREIANIKGTWQ